MEQLQAEKERLLYDMQRRVRPLDNDEDRSAIRRGLQAGQSQPYPASLGGTDPDTEPSEAEGPAPSDSLPTLPPGPPSSASSASLARSGVGSNREWHAKEQRHAEAAAEPTANTPLGRNSMRSSTQSRGPPQSRRTPAQPGLHPAPSPGPQYRLPLGRNSRTDDSTQRGPHARQPGGGGGHHPWVSHPPGRNSMHCITQVWLRTIGGRYRGGQWPSRSWTSRRRGRLRTWGSVAMVARWVAHAPKRTASAMCETCHQIRYIFMYT